MNALKRSLISLIAIGALGASAAGIASASSDRTQSARLQATGSGKMVLSGHVVTFGLTSGRGRIVVVDRRGDANVTVNGRTRMRSLKSRRRMKRRVVIKRANGRFYVRGSWVTVLVQGTHLNLTAAGSGKARLRGVGRYTLNRSAARDWSRDPRRWRNLRLRPPSAR